MMHAPDQLQDLARRYTAAWCGREPGAVAALYAPGGSLRVNDGEPAVGRGAITEVARGFMTTFPDMEVRMDSLLARSGRVFYRWTLTGTNRGPGGTGCRVNITGFEEWQIGADGLIALSR